MKKFSLNLSKIKITQGWVLEFFIGGMFIFVLYLSEFNEILKFLKFLLVLHPLKITQKISILRKRQFHFPKCSEFIFRITKIAKIMSKKKL